jgi:hypothetical protein
MFKKLFSTLALVEVLSALLAGSAIAASTSGKIVSYKHTKHTHSGTLVVKTTKGKKSFVVPDNIVCGYQRGYSGGPLDCTTLNKYKGDVVNLRFTTKHNTKTASWVSVVLKK